MAAFHPGAWRVCFGASGNGRALDPGPTNTQPTSDSSIIAFFSCFDLAMLLLAIKTERGALAESV